jgi:Arf-GAP/GTPase/ANK repeat/PH domain-containing protein 1/3
MSANNFLPNSQIQLTNSSFIKSEIERFESVHPSIYSIYELIDELRDELTIQSQIREHVMIIEDSFVNSQEWTLSRSVLDIRIGLLGTLNSGKSALVHRFLTGTYMQEDSPEGGRFKKEINIDNQNYLLLIRDEANAPDTQFTHWVDAVIFVFSLENEESFKTIYQYYTKMNHYRNISDMPLILVGTQDAISESNPRVIHEDRARKLANELKRCTYYETCATYGLNVERIFHDICQKVVQQRYGFSTSTLSSNRSITPQQPSPISNQMRILANSQSVPSTSHLPANINLIQTAPASVFSSYHYDQQPPILSPPNQNFAIAQLAQCLNTQTINGVLKDRNNQQQMQLDKRTRSFKEQQSGMKLSTLSETHSLPIHESQTRVDTNEQLTPTSTPTQKRKDTKRKSNLFTPGKKDEEKNKTDRLGHGRAIPIKQGFLYKKGTNSINRDWKKKYVVLLDDGRIIYHPSLHDYENDSHGKEIILQRTTIKIPGSNKPRVALRSANNDPKSNDTLPFDLSGKIETPNSKKRHRRLQQSNISNPTHNSSKSMSNNNGGDDDGDENIFTIVSLDKQWFFEAQSNEERDEWVQAIEQQILFSLQNIESSKAARAAKIGGTTIADSASVQTIKQIPGNGFCADCDQINPTWASLNLGALICMDCASLHRNLGTHLSRVRSLELDEWP